MPIIPRYESNQNIQARTPAPVKNEATESFAPMREIAQTLTKIEADWRETEGIIETSEAKAFHSTKLAEIQANADLDPDYKNSPVYQEELQKANSDALGMINNKRFRNAAAFDFQKDSAITGIKIDNQFKKKGMAAWKVSTDNMITAEANRDYSTLQEKQQAYENVSTYIANGVAKGIIDAEEAQKAIDSFLEQQINNDIYRNPEQFLERANTDWYEFDDEEQRGQKIRKAERLIQNRDSYERWQVNQRDMNGAYELSTALMQGNLTEQGIESLRTSGMIKDDTAALFNEILVNGKFEIPDSTKLGKPDYFLRLIDKALDDKTDPKNILVDAAKAYGKNELGINQYAYFIEGAKERMDRVNKKGIGERLRNFKFNYESIKDLATAVYPPAMYAEKAADMMRRVMDKMSDGDNVKDATDKVMQEELEADIISLSEGDEEMTSFNSFEEAENADLPKGTRILIDGIEYEVE